VVYYNSGGDLKKKFVGNLSNLSIDLGYFGVKLKGEIENIL
jgi:hypothetical protein